MPANPPMTAAFALEIHGLAKRFDRPAVDGLELAVRAGEFYALLGANGAGKTTTLRALCAMVKSRGAIAFDGHRIDHLPTEDIVRRGIAHVPDGRGTFTQLTTEENLRLGAYTRKDKTRVAADIERLYGYFPRLKERRRQPAGTLSGGEQQMLALARALMLRPRLLLLDEPSFGLAPLVVQEFFEILGEIKRSEGVGVLLVEQNAAVALALADQAYIIETGRIVLTGRGDEIRRNDAVRASYLGY